jgi:hypothetical protein
METAMKRQGNNGNGKTGKISLYDENWFQKISHLVAGLTETEKKAIEVIVAKEPSDTWDEVAKRIGITARQLYNIRQNGEVQEACYIIAKELFKTETPDVLKVLAKKAKNGDNYCIKLFLEVSGELKQSSDEPPKVIIKELEQMSDEELEDLAQTP